MSVTAFNARESSKYRIDAPRERPCRWNEPHRADGLREALGHFCHSPVLDAKCRQLVGLHQIRDSEPLFILERTKERLCRFECEHRESG